MVAPAAPELIIERVFNAPRALVWQAWTDHRHMVNWMGPPKCPATHCEGEIKPGGKWRTRLDSAEQGKELCHGGEYREVVEPERLVFTFSWDDDAGKPGNMMLITLTFEEQGPKKTKLTLHQTGFLGVEQRDAHNGGWNGTFDRLETVLAKQSG